MKEKLAFKTFIVAYKNFKSNFSLDFKVGYHIKVTLENI